MPTSPGARQRICWWGFLVMGLFSWEREQNPTHLLFPSGNSFCYLINWLSVFDIFICYYNSRFFTSNPEVKSKSFLLLFILLFLVSWQGGRKDKALPCAAGGSDRGAGHFRVWQFSRSHQLLWEAPFVPQNETALPHQRGHTGEDRHCCEYRKLLRELLLVVIVV